MVHLGSAVVLDAGDSYRQTIFTGLEGALHRYTTRHSATAGCNCFLARFSDINFESACIDFLIGKTRPEKPKKRKVTKAANETYSTKLNYEMNGNVFIN